MPKANTKLIQALREAASNLKGGVKYEWGHMGRCNCGHLVQTATQMTDVEIVKSIDHELDEWTEHAKDYCAVTNHKVDDLFATMESIGFDRYDMSNLEYLSDKNVLDALPNGRYLHRNNPQHVSLYMDTMADLLEEQLV
ncbi:hypothetical protein [Candidatus Uabimicrobium amorphum]|uniref:Uncharacterized protein n=1 Tax=Uabimicrobium amorphum TaxID=2596890 RepID=A0A5S9F2J3_UABAM|nr:hypothetical protein [Candidatus Uabimicrobium amorphum]BBM83522.1 hypothetical protein UABAM_01874 [Candidatus Uabimicrobium amorphum]